jgi:hypothetical protein
MNNNQQLTVEFMFGAMCNSARLLRQNDRSADGLMFWHRFKDFFKGIQIETEWKTTCDNLKELSYDQQEVMKLEEFVTLGDGSIVTREMNHFKIQTVRIPLNNKASFVKIMQLALNIGQYVGSGGHLTHWMCIHDYISGENLDKINTELRKNEYENKLNEFLLLVNC